MNIYTVRDNLKNTIEGKEMLLETYKNPGVNPYPNFVKEAMIQFLETNVVELKRILQDVEVCCQQHNEMGWQINPERMGQ